MEILTTTDITLAAVKRNLPRRFNSSNKSDGGKVLIVGGNKDLFGAGIISALAATRTGAGYTYLMTEINKYPWVKCPDFIIHPFSLAVLKKHTKSAIGFGPGVGTTIDKKKLLLFLIKNEIEKVVLDGDGLTLLSKIRIKSLPEAWILTPHESELARLLKIKVSDVKENRLKYVRAAQIKYGCTVVLKGARTLVATSKLIYVVKSGTKALAKAGTGDVLLGVISALLAQGIRPSIAAYLGCYIHGYASRLWIRDKNDYLGLRPLDLIDKIPEAIFRIRKS